ncbi:hypothetical protein Golomagni_03093 [Golovinomyces magnicellulatus]|nr:hypothetical protein Golomagni_03093 [Golovinomyces magnicellulatus]
MKLQAWHAISYKLIREQNPNKLPSECFFILVHTLNAKRRGLDPSQRSNDAMHTRLTNACWGIPEFQSVLSAPSPHLSKFIKQLKMAFSNHHAIKEETPSTYISESYLQNNEESLEVNFTNRRFRDNHRSRGGSRSGYRHKGVTSVVKKIFVLGSITKINAIVLENDERVVHISTLLSY